MVEFYLAQAPDLARIVEIYNQSIPTRLATADLTPVTVNQKKDWFASLYSHPSIVGDKAGGKDCGMDRVGTLLWSPCL